MGTFITMSGGGMRYDREKRGRGLFGESRERVQLGEIVKLQVNTVSQKEYLSSSFILIFLFKKREFDELAAIAQYDYDDDNNNN